MTWGTLPCLGAITVIIHPDLAVQQGAQWRVDDQETWYDSNVPVALPLGIHRLEFKNLSDWSEPSPLSVVDSEGTAQTINVSYSGLTRHSLGMIPDQVAWQDLTLEFMVYLADTGGTAVTDAVITAETLSSPLAVFSFLPATEPGYFVFHYAPAAGARESFQVFFEGKSPGFPSTVYQLIQITPMQNLVDEAVVFKTGQYSEVISEDTAIHKNEDILTEVSGWNYQPWKTRVISIEGNRIEISRLHDANQLYNQLCATTDPGGNLLNGNIRTLQIVADVLVVKTRLWLPGTGVTIKAVSLYFEDEDPTIPACLVTTPFSLTERPVLPPGVLQGVNGFGGLTAGNILIDVVEFHSAQLSDGTNPQRFILDGGNGQPAGQGRNGAAGPTLPYQDSFHVRIKETTLGLDKFWSPLASSPPYKITSVLYHDHSSGWDFDWGSPPTGWSGSTQLPHGENAIPGGLPGAGGNAGQIQCAIPIANLYSITAGQKGQNAPAYTGGPRGEPLYYLQLVYDLYGSWGGTGTIYTNGGYSGMAHAGTDAASPDDSGVPNGQIGDCQVIASNMEQLSPEMFVYYLNHIRQLYLANQLDACKQKIERSIRLIELMKQGPYWVTQPLVRKCCVETVYNDLRSMQNRIENGLDYFGNPAGWVPRLSFEVTRSMFETEINRAMDILYLSYWLREKAAATPPRVSALTETIKQLKDEITFLKQRYTDAVNALPDLETEATLIDEKIGMILGKLKAREDQLRQQANDHLRDPWWETGLKTAACLCKMIPVRQPALGSVGDGMDLAADFDKLDPWGVIRAIPDLGTTLVSSGLTQKAQIQKDDLSTVNLDQTENLQTNEVYLSTLSGDSGPVIRAISEISNFIATREAPASQIEAELARLVTHDATFKSLADEINELLSNKEILAGKIASTVRSISVIPGQISLNLQAINSLVREKPSTQDKLSNEALDYLTSMENRANDRLIKYHYYMAKGYEYRLLLPYTQSLDLTPIFNELKSYADAHPNDGTTLPTAQRDILNGLYQHILSNIANEIYTLYSDSGSLEYEVTVKFWLLPEELEAINTGQTCTLNPLDMSLFGGTEENLRIVDMSVVEITAAPEDGIEGDPAYVDVRIKHPGESKLKSNGNIYLFRNSEGGNSPSIEWGCRYDLKDADDPIDKGIEAIRPSAASESLLRSLLVEGNATSNMMLYSLPAVWANLEISKNSVNRIQNGSGVVVHDNIRIQSLRLELKYNFVRKKQNLVELQVGVVQAVQQNGNWIDTPSSFQPCCTLSRKDANGRQEGRGQFLRIYPRTLSGTVVLSAQPVYENWIFHSWVDQGGQPLSTPSPQSTELTLPLNADASVFARYVPRDMMPADLNRDRNVNIADFALIARCYVAQCNSFEFDGSEDSTQIDMQDVASFCKGWLMDIRSLNTTQPPTLLPGMPSPQSFDHTSLNNPRSIEIVEIHESSPQSKMGK
jgi:hypothetical protein